MSTAIAEVMRQHGAPAADFEETLREIEAVKAVRFAWHPWMPLNNIGGDSFQFGVNLPVLGRLEPIPLLTVTRPEILGPKPGLTLTGRTYFVGSDSSLEESATGFGGAAVGGKGANVRQFRQTPENTLADLLNAFNHFGMTALASLDAADERELELSFSLYETVMGEAHDEAEEEAGRRPAGLLLEDFPRWLDRGAPRAVERAYSNGIVRMVADVRDGKVVGYVPKRYAAPKVQERRIEQLISEIRAGIMRAEATAIGPENGILVRTRKLIQNAKNNLEGKGHFDGQDLWLMEQYPSFPMDTDVERASNAVQEAVETGAKANAETTAALLAVVQQNQQFMQMMAQQQAETNRLLAAALKPKGKQAGDGA